MRLFHAPSGCARRSAPCRSARAPGLSRPPELSRPPVLSSQFCAELNQPVLPNIRKWKGPRGSWKAVVAGPPSTPLQKGAGFPGFLWDASAGVELRDAAPQDGSPGNGHGKPAGPSPYLARFKVPPLPVAAQVRFGKERPPLKP